MAIEDLNVFREQLPEAFEDKSLPPGWEEDWIVARIDAPESDAPSGIEMSETAVPISPNVVSSSSDASGLPPSSFFEEGGKVPDFGEPSTPGALQQWRPPEGVPPPDAFAFYLPFHYFHPVWWG